MQLVEELGFQNGFFQPWEENACDELTPDFRKENPFIKN
jgi:hypothetical protein